MPYAKVIDESVSMYPYNFENLKKDNSNVSFPKDFFERENELADFDVVKIQVTDKPHKKDSVCVEEEPSFANGKWSQTWKLVPEFTDAEVEQREAKEAAWNAGAFDRAITNLRYDRDRRIAQTDWYALQDVTMSDAMRDYRKDLRDLPEGLTTAEEVEAVTWPTKP
jgi:hypothetical protein|tara:strand:- start:362 stop:859 length:498 start_codon:yes stop_codon:yes gene_type:complete